MLLLSCLLWLLYMLLLLQSGNQKDVHLLKLMFLLHREEHDLMRAAPTAKGRKKKSGKVQRPRDDDKPASSAPLKQPSRRPATRKAGSRHAASRQSSSLPSGSRPGSSRQADPFPVSPPQGRPPIPVHPSGPTQRSLHRPSYTYCSLAHCSFRVSLERDQGILNAKLQDLQTAPWPFPPGSHDSPLLSSWHQVGRWPQ